MVREQKIQADHSQVTTHDAMTQTSRTIYCPYTDREVPESVTSSEHIIPLSLGGVNGFEIPVDAAFNSQAGHELDGALANEFLFALDRTKYDARGHSGREPVATFRKASYGENERQAHVHLHRKHGIHVWDVRDREYKKGVGSVRVNTSLNIDLPVRFTAKVALAAGYYVYGDLFRQYVDHHQLRDVMNIDPAKLDRNKGATELGLDHLSVRIDHYLHEAPSESDWKIRALRAFCSWVKGSVVVLVPGSNCLAVGVGLMSRYLAMVNVPAKTESFPNRDCYAWGHVVAMIDKKLKRCSWVDGLRQWVDATKPTPG